MKTSSIAFRFLEIPYKHGFRHPFGTNMTGSSVLIEVSDGEISGYGEACPGIYVAGGDINTVHKFFKQHQGQWSREIYDVSTLKAWLSMHKSAIDNAPIAWSAVELALLDLFAKQKNQTVEALLSVPEVCSEFKCTAMLGNTSPAIFKRALERYWRSGITDFKIKLSGIFNEDKEKLQLMREWPYAIEVRVDGGSLWRDADVAIDYLSALEYPFWAVEEPLRPGCYSQLRTIGGALDCRIILNESFTCGEQLDCLIGDGQPWIVNICISKLGGLLRTLNIIKRLRCLHIPVVIGAHAGETGILTRAALTAAAAAKDVVLAQDSVFGIDAAVGDIDEIDAKLSNGAKLMLFEGRQFEGDGFGTLIDADSGGIKHIIASH